MRIVARGIKNGKEITVEVTDRFGEGEVACLVDGVDDVDCFIELLTEIELNGAPMGGTYYPQTKELKWYSALTEWYFDRSPDILCAEGVEEMVPQPNGKHAVY